MLLSAIPTKSLDLYHLANRREAERAGLFADQRVYIGIIELSNRAALATDQELSGVGAARVRATDESVQ